MPAYLKVALSNRPSTVASVATAIAFACCDPRQASVCAAWQPAQAALPTKCAAATADRDATGGAGADGRSRHHPRARTTAATPATTTARRRQSVDTQRV